MQHDFESLHASVRAQSERGRQETDRGPIDALALATAQLTQDEISASLDLRLTLYEWSLLTAIIRRRVATAIRHTAFDPKPFGI